MFSVLVFSLAIGYGLDGVPDSETGLLSAMAEVAGLHQAGITVKSSALLLLARLAGLGMIASFAAVLVTRKRLGRRPDDA